MKMTNKELIGYLKYNLKEVRKKVKEIEEALEQELFEKSFYEIVHKKPYKNTRYIKYLRNGILLQNKIKETFISFLAEVSAEYIGENVKNKK